MGDTVNVTLTAPIDMDTAAVENGTVQVTNNTTGERTDVTVTERSASSIVASARILTDLAFQRNVQPALDTIQPYVVVLMHLSGVVDRLPVAC